uniref:Uncharacterized protein n=1 Tax=Sphaerodactylus townsendi TaxID=933632 RepID=A0ACB8F9Z1_9SAUR
MPKDTFYFTILRDPILSLESSYVYYKNYSPAFKNSSNVNEFLSSPWTYYDLNVKIYNIHARNNMWFDFGYDNNAEDDDYYVQSIIQNIEQNFHLILIANYFDESMILLQNTLCWDLDGVANILGYNLKQDLDNMTIKICRRMIMPEVQYVSHLYRQQFPHKTGKPTD